VFKGITLCEIIVIGHNKIYLENKMRKTKYLTLKNILDINKKISKIALGDERILFGANSDNEIDKIEKLIECTPKNKSIIEVAAYYLKNITILQAFSDGNHRTAIGAVLFFLKQNDYVFTYNIKDRSSTQLRNDIDKACFEVYGYSYHAMDTDVLNDDDNQVYLVCLDFIKKRLLQPNSISTSYIS